MTSVTTMIKINHHPPKFGLTMVCISVYWLLFCCRVSILLSCTRTHLCSSCKLPVHFHRTHVGSVRMAAGSCLVYHSTHKDRHSESNEHLRKQKETEEVRQSERQTNRQTDRQTNRQTDRQTDILLTVKCIYFDVASFVLFCVILVLFTIFLEEVQW